MIEKLKNLLVPKLLAIFFIYYHLFGLKFVMFTILERLDLPLTDYHYPVLNIFTIIFTIVLVIYLRRRRPEIFQITSLKPLDYLLILLAFGVIYTYFNKLLFVGGDINNDLLFFRHSPQAFLVALQPFIVGPILEELVYRGVLMTSFFEKSKFYLDCLLSAVMFSVAHLFSYGVSLEVFKNYAFLGLILAILFRKTRSIYPSILVHMAWNIYLSWHLIAFVFFAQ
ncbi:CPBP family intramembrane glutamic endopeptidase [Streptococcus gallolyticus]|uniref:Bacteriocin-associated membrane-bound metalloprotease n=1 Tax=Streptococcus gallolyticus TaxID=315405 RepID=A0AA94M3T0_9STRE|nr:type II CAAX endopeptidase family protein [Streptococcus gallolyticus]AQP43137.1 bacteriocin-associated membrane-boundmetalloprotease/immunity protein BlpY [Streptococcus gallolyticus subsp. gallolyticus DSM 16831]MCY7184745.1 CPBP family intramembrane metalloprotease [Streptococcus gallolyticus subsp. gallolyticus]MCY7188682.1 CPBP family intramembrane metalloprotease [Streptococcus gallolyticus subsp. gallolyticus]MCY7192066.1 CPBP family intramembrane metalloprotease [Streptococcus gallol